MAIEKLIKTNKKKYLKNIFDFFIAFLLFLFIIPILIIFTVLILIFEGRPIFYISQRGVSIGKKVKVIKFRTMVRDATSEVYKLNERYMRNGYLDIPLCSEVYTPIGRVLEKTQIVEAFQLLNVIKGEMSLVGNRPLPESNLTLLKVLPGWQERFRSPAGITGISQVAGKYEIQPEQRLHLETAYTKIYNSPRGNVILCDLLIIWHTILLMMKGKYLGYERALKLLEKCYISASK